MRSLRGNFMRRSAAFETRALLTGALAGIGLWFATSAGPAQTAEVLVDGIAAQVGSDIVLVSEVMQMVGPMEKRLRDLGADDEELAKVRAEALERMIEWRLVERVVRAAEFFATEAEIDELIEMIANENSMTSDQLRVSVETNDMTYIDYRGQLRREIERRKVIAAMIKPRVRLDDDAARDLFLERYADQPKGGVEVHVRQILLTFGGDTGRDERLACSVVRKGAIQIRNGANFGDVASDVSEVAPERGGDIGWLMETSLAGWMRKIIDPMKPGEISELLVLPFGCALLELVDRRDYKPVEFDEVRARLTEEALRAALADTYATWLEEQRAATFIERRGYFAGAADLRDPTLFEPSPSYDDRIGEETLGR